MSKANQNERCEQCQHYKRNNRNDGRGYACAQQCANDDFERRHDCHCDLRRSDCLSLLRPQRTGCDLGRARSKERNAKDKASGECECHA